MSNYIDRLMVEYNDLIDKIAKLQKFMYADAFYELAPLQRNLLRAQLGAMTGYANILLARIDDIQGMERN